jgi:RimJ/RimL family protein N-acetyltransferase
MANNEPAPDPTARRVVRKRRLPPRSARRARAARSSAAAPPAAFNPLTAFPPAPPPGDDAPLLAPHEMLFGGHPHTVRLLGPADEGRLISFFYSHSGETIRQRYGYRISEMTHERAQQLVGVDQSRDVALGVFERAADGEEVLHAVGRYLLEPGGQTAEMAFVVRETKRGLGLCTALVRRLLQIARARGIGYLFAQVQADNAPMLAVFRRHGGRTQTIPGADAIEVFVPTAQP